MFDSFGLWFCSVGISVFVRVCVLCVLFAVLLVGLLLGHCVLLVFVVFRRLFVGPLVLVGCCPLFC